MGLNIAGLTALSLVISGSFNACFAGCMDTDNKLWLTPSNQSIYDRLMALMACPADVDSDTGRQVDAVACNYFVAKGLNDLYGVNDFTSASNNGIWLTANQIADFVRSHPELWSDLGSASSQQTLADAAAGAAQNQPTIAVMKGDPHGHVAILLPGTLEPSTTWALNVPNSAAFSLNNVSKAYVFCRLSAAFSDPSQVEIYWRVKSQ